jgi:hypothetical protein
MRLAPLLSISLFLCGASLRADSQNWPCWRGKHGTGSVAAGNPPIKWAEKTDQSPAKNIAWKVEIPGHGSSSPITWQDRIYLTTAIKTTRTGESTALEEHDQRALAPPKEIWQFAVLALNLHDGSLCWSTVVTEATPHEGGHSTNSHASGSPVTDGKHIYVNFGSRGVYCLNMNGEVVWSKDFGLMRTRRQYGEGASPALFGDRLIVNWDHEGDSFIVVLDKHTGEELWRKPRPEVTSWSTPIVVEVDGRPQIIINATTASRGYDLENGEVIWSLGGMTVNCIPIPMYAKGVVYLMSGYRGQMLQAVKLAGARGDLEGGPNVLWTHSRNTSYVPSGALHKDRLYFLRGNNPVLSCLDAATGKVIYEGQRLNGLNATYASPLCVDDRVYITSRKGATLVMDVEPPFKQLALNQLDEPIDASPAIVGDALFLRGEHHLYCIADDSAPAPEAISYYRVGSLGTYTERTASLSTGDVDADGDLDLIAANGRHWPCKNRLFLNDGKGGFTETDTLGADESTTYTVALADLDGDGDLDGVAGNDRLPSTVLVNDGHGRFTKGGQVGPISKTRSVTLADLDGRNGIDVILTNRREANLICFNDGKGGFERQTTFGAVTDATINVAVGDVDGDGDPDIAVANRDGMQNQIYLNDGQGGFTKTVPYGTGSDSTRGIALADMDGDGHLDILNANIGEPNAVYYGNGAAGFARTTTFGGQEQSYALVPADLNGDRRLDIVVGNVKSPNAIYLQNTDGTFQQTWFGAPDGSTYGLVVADWNGDGRPEIATANSDGLNYLYAQQPDASLKAQ